jgi:hypothetical protein
MENNAGRPANVVEPVARARACVCVCVCVGGGVTGRYDYSRAKLTKGARVCVTSLLQRNVRHSTRRSRNKNTAHMLRGLSLHGNIKHRHNIQLRGRITHGIELGCHQLSPINSNKLRPIFRNPLLQIHQPSRTYSIIIIRRYIIFETDTASLINQNLN